MTGNIDPITIYKISISGCKTMCFVETVTYDDNSILFSEYMPHLRIFDIRSINNL